MALKAALFAASAAAATASAFVDTSTWSGAEYTPARAPGNSLWWAHWDAYAADVDRELGFLKQRFGYTVLRMFLHSKLYEANKTLLYSSIDSFLGVATKHGMQAGLVFFDSCWADHCWWQAPGSDCNIYEPCTPVKGRHNGCWLQSPLAADRTSVDRYMPYIRDTVSRYNRDARVVYWEIYNEPRMSDPFIVSLRSAAYAEALAASPSQPVLSCWDDNNSTQAVDAHHYDTDFPTLTSQVYANVTKGGTITEGGSRWFQGYPSDAGSPKTFVTWYNNLHGPAPSPAPPASFKTGMLINWEGMVGGSNTRWHWNTPDGSPEPTIPWDASMFADGTPVSHTEAALIRGWTVGVDDFLGYAGFLPNDTWAFNGDYFLTLPSGDGWTLGVDGVALRDEEEGGRARPSPSAGTLHVPGGSLTDFLAEATVWPSNTTGGGMVLRSGVGPDGQVEGYFVGFRATGSAHPALVVETWGPGSVTQLASFDMSNLDCGLVTDGWNMLRAVIKGGGPHADLQIAVYANPMFNESLAPAGIQPRLNVVNIPTTGTFFGNGGVTLVAVPDALPLGEGGARRAAVAAAGGVGTVVRGPTVAESLGRPLPQHKKDARAALGEAAAQTSSSMASGLWHAPIVPPGFAAFDYIGVLPLSVL